MSAKNDIIICVNKKSMDSRQELILNTIISEHIETGLPVASAALVRKYNLDISAATVRNEMAALEMGGYIAQPHTSAGRVPTELAYNLYLKKLKIKKLAKTCSDNIDTLLETKNEISFKEIAKLISQVSGNAVFWAFHKHNLYYTGISNLFQQPEFARINVIHDISGVIDRLDEIIGNLIEETEMGTHTTIGSSNPFGNIFGTTLAKYRLNGNTGMFGVIGPVRMDYEKTISLIEYVNNNLKKN